jgi:hypothetical protein
MKAKFKFTRIFPSSIIVLFLLTINSELKAQVQQSTDLKDFKITIEKTPNGLKMQSLTGSAWIDLSFTIANDNPQAINAFGMTELDKKNSVEDPNLADYLFTITKTKNEIILTGIEGTAWQELSITLPKNGKLTVDQFGISE